MSYNERMQQHAKIRQFQWRFATWVVGFVILILAVAEFLPLLAALRVGIAGLSIVVFAPLFILAVLLGVVMYQQKQLQTMLLAALSATVALLALLGPVLAYSSVAQQQGVSLRFDLPSYVGFTGDSIPPTRTIVYKTADGQPLHLAVYGDKDPAPKPAVLLVHGGGWQYGEYQRTNHWPALLRDAGYRVISIQYRLATSREPTWNKAPTDIGDAVAYVKTHADELGVAQERIGLFGQSAGGHLALLEAHKNRSVQAVVGLYAPTDLTAD